MSAVSPSRRRGRKPGKPVPHFATEAEELEFWAAQDSAGYVDWSQAEDVALPRLRPSTTTISLRLPESLLKIYLAERVASERRRKAG